jgi:(4-O-methyl)-D-glucuronate---lignin esterase
MACVAVLSSGLLAAGAAGAAASGAPVELTAEQDHRRLLDLLHIPSLRPGANGRDPQAPNAANYDETKANPYPRLPDPLLLKNGQRVTTAAAWRDRRRPEIVEDFDREVYGRAPRQTPAVRWEVTRTEPSMVGDRAVVTKTLVGRVDNAAFPAIAVDIDLRLTTPATATRPVPVVLQLGFNFAAAGRTPPPPPGGAADAGPTWQEQVLARGWGYAILYPTSVQPDNGAGLTRGIIGLVNRGQPRALDDWGALRAWAWGASRALDYLMTDASVDGTRVAIQGHSRFGKAALVAMAYDPRFAAAFISSSGAGGAALHRRHWGELVENVAGPGEYHWMAGNYLKYAGPRTADDLPVDSHELIALCAPRPVFIGAGDKGDEWVDPRGMFLAAAAAGPVYALLGARGLGTDAFPPLETTIAEGDVAFRQHPGGHTPGPNWPAFLEFAARYLDGAARPPATSGR